ncbi:MAG TPA: GNAT family N-acetyltransferase [Candidatus Saccharibacteria bacterium]|nr:GNAT family N-acetyltransferase [Candidatus Saccharibacteria bacterium]
MSITRFDMETRLKAADPRTEDIFAIGDLWRQIGDNNIDAITHDPETLRSVMAGLDYLVLRDDSCRLIGAVSVLDCRQRLAKIDSLAVHPEHQGKRYGYELARSAVKHCVTHGYEQIITHAKPAAQKLFNSLGFETYEVNKTGNATMFLDLK